MTNLSNDAFAIIAQCPEAGNKCFGITVDSLGINKFKFVWAFKIDKDKAKREGYDIKKVHGAVELDEDYPGCPYCHSKKFLFCSCGTILCWHGQRRVKCPNCGAEGEVESVSTVDLNGGSM